MYHNIRLFIFLFCLLLIACTSQSNYIIPISLSDYWPDTLTGVTVEDSRKRGYQMFQDVKHNTLGKEIPPLWITGLDGDSVNLKDIIISKSIIISCDAHCGFSSDHAMNDFQKALQKLNNHDIYPEVICLAKRFDIDIDEPERFNRLLNELQSLYSNLYIITEDVAAELNLIGGSGRMIVNEDQIVESLGFGISISQDDRIFDELYKILKKK